MRTTNIITPTTDIIKIILLAKNGAPVTFYSQDTSFYSSYYDFLLE